MKRQEMKKRVTIIEEQRQLAEERAKTELRIERIRRKLMVIKRLRAARGE